MLVQCCVSVADGGPTMYQHWVNRLLFATSWKGKVSCVYACLQNTLTGLRLKMRFTAGELTAELTATELTNCNKFYIYV